MNWDSPSCGLIFWVPTQLSSYLLPVGACHSSFSPVGIIDLSNLKYMHHAIWPLPLSQCSLYYLLVSAPTLPHLALFLSMVILCLLSALKFLQIQSKLFTVSVNYSVLTQNTRVCDTTLSSLCFSASHSSFNTSSGSWISQHSNGENPVVDWGTSQ